MNSGLFVARTFAAPAAAVYDAWVSPGSVVAPVTEVEWDARVGGALRLSTGGSPEADLHGTVIEADRPRHLRYTWCWGGSPEESVIDVVIRDLGERCVVEVTHQGFLDESSRQTHLEGWVSYFDGLEGFL